MIVNQSSSFTHRFILTQENWNCLHICGNHCFISQVLRIFGLRRKAWFLQSHRIWKFKAILIMKCWQSSHTQSAQSFKRYSNEEKTDALVEKQHQVFNLCKDCWIRASFKIRNNLGQAFDVCAVHALPNNALFFIRKHFI